MTSFAYSFFEFEILVGSCFLRQVTMVVSSLVRSSRLVSTSEKTLFMEPFHVLGGGSIGLLFAASIRMAFPSYPLQVLLRSSDKIENKTITICLEQKIKGERSTIRIVHVPARMIASDTPARKIRNLVVTTKAFQATAAIQSVEHLIDETTRIVLLCNGTLAVQEELSISTTPAWTTHGAYQIPNSEMYHVVQAGFGQTCIRDNSEIASLWDRAGLNCHSLNESEMMRSLWMKLAANCAINPLTALRTCENGALLDNHDDGQLQLCIREVAQVAQHITGGDPGLSVQVLTDFVHKVILDTAANKSSMLQDVLAKRQTEIDYLNGFIVKQGMAAGIDCPVNKLLWKQVRALKIGSDL
jgi:2-dehydropantoate 2-reductase